MTAVYITQAKCNGPRGAKILVPNLGENLESIAVCFRFIIKEWFSNIIYLLTSPSLSIIINSYDKPLITIKIDGNVEGIYNWTNVLSLSQFRWNSLCLSYNSTSKQSRLYLNGLILPDVSQSLLSINDDGYFNMSFIEIGNNPNFDGYLTDIYVWNKQLTDDEVLHYSLRNLSSMLSGRNSMALKWSEATVNYNTSCIKLSQFDPKDMAIHSVFMKRKYFFKVTRKEDFITAKKHCSALNGRIFFPQTHESLEFVLKEISKLNEPECNFTIWTPFQRKNFLSTMWNTGNQSEKQFYDPWTLQSESDGLCLYLNIANSTLHHSDCKTRLCSVCELEQERLIYHLQFDFAEKRMTSHEKPYILSADEDGSLYFAGVTGLWKIRKGMFFRTQPFKEPLFVAKLDSSYGISGLQKWEIKDSKGKNMSMAKLTNVRNKKNIIKN